MDEERISLATLADGAAIEMIDEGLEAAWKDIIDPNTPAKSKRSVTLILTLEPDEDRNLVTIGIQVDKKLAKVRPSVARVELCRGAGGKLIAVELRSRQAELPGVNENEDENVISLERSRS